MSSRQSFHPNPSRAATPYVLFSRRSEVPAVPAALVRSFLMRAADEPTELAADVEEARQGSPSVRQGGDR